jgi:hypothetical protein
MDWLKYFYWALMKGDPVVNVGVLIAACLLVLALLLTGSHCGRCAALPVTLIFVVAATLFFVLGPHDLNVYDEGLILTGALRILSGEAPSADF